VTDGRSAQLHAELAPFLDKPGPRKWSDRGIDEAAIWNFCAAVEDPNPVYWSAEAAARSRFGRVIAPPQSLMALNMDAFWLPPVVTDQRAAEREALAASPQQQARAVLRGYGFTTVTVVSREEEYLAPFGPGDGRFAQEDRFVAVSDIKNTRVGTGVFFTYEIDYYTERDDDLVARARNVTLMYDGTGTTK
jgi:acyl dehydratase